MQPPHAAPPAYAADRRGPVLRPARATIFPIVGLILAMAATIGIMLWFSARYRQYDFNNRTEPFVVTNGVNYDTAIVALNKESEPFSQTRQDGRSAAKPSP